MEPASRRLIKILPAWSSSLVPAPSYYLILNSMLKLSSSMYSYMSTLLYWFLFFLLVAHYLTLLIPNWLMICFFILFAIPSNESNGYLEKLELKNRFCDSCAVKTKPLSSITAFTALQLAHCVLVTLWWLDSKGKCPSRSFIAFCDLASEVIKQHFHHSQKFIRIREKGKIGPTTW